MWHRTSALKPAELATLKTVGVHTLYWQAAECEWQDSRWKFVRISPPQAASGDITIIPVFRIKPDSAFLGSPIANAAFVDGVRAWCGEPAALPAEIQLDFDCPARLLDRYAAFLRSLAVALPTTQVSATALASWPDAAGFQEFARSVKSLAPMFYDLAEDLPEDVCQNRFHPMADPTVEKWIQKWVDCPVPWIAGLPNFERLSVFAADGKLVGHIRSWDHDSVFFHSALTARALGNGTTLFEIRKPIELYDTTLAPGMKLVHRTCDSAVLSKLRDACHSLGASGAVYFTLPGPGIHAALTPEHLAQPTGAPPSAPHFTIAEDGSVTLKNQGPTDLPTHIWELEIHSDHPAAFLSGSPGGFVEWTTPNRLPPEMTNTLVLRFSRLPAGASISSGPLVKRSDGVTWQLRDVLKPR